MKKLLSQVFFAFVAILLCSMVFGFVAKRFLDITVVTVDRALGFAVLCSVVVFAVQLFYYHRDDRIPDVSNDPAKKLLAREYAQRMTALPMPDMARRVRMPSHLLAPHVVNLTYYMWERDQELVLFPRWKDIEEHLYLLQDDKTDVEYYQVLLQPLHIPISSVQYISRGSAREEQNGLFTVLRYQNALAEAVELLFTEDSFDELRRALPTAELQTEPAVSFREQRIRAKKRMPVMQEITPALDLTEIVSAIQKLKEANLIDPTQKSKAPDPVEEEERVEEPAASKQVVQEELPTEVPVADKETLMPEPEAEVLQKQAVSQTQQDEEHPVSQKETGSDQIVAVLRQEEPKPLTVESQQQEIDVKDEEDSDVAAAWGQNLWANRKNGTTGEYSDSDSPDIAAAWRHLKPKPDKTITPFPKRQEASSDIASTWWKLTQPEEADEPAANPSKRPKRSGAIPEGAGEIASWNTPEAQPEPRRPESKPIRQPLEQPVRSRPSAAGNQRPGDLAPQRQRPAAVRNQPAAAQRKPQPGAARRPANRRPKEYLPQEHRNRLQADWELLDISSQIQQLKEMWAQSLIDEQEYETQKVRLMNMM